MLSFAVAEQDCFGSLLWLLNSKGSSWEDGISVRPVNGISTTQDKISSTGGNLPCFYKNVFPCPRTHAMLVFETVSILVTVDYLALCVYIPDIAIQGFDAET